MSRAQTAFFILFVVAGCSVIGGGVPVNVLTVNKSISQIDEHVLDLQAIVGMPSRYGESSADYIGRTLQLLQVQPFERRVYRNKKLPGKAVYPIHTHGVDSGKVAVDLVILPRPRVVKEWMATASSKQVGWTKLQTSAFDNSLRYGRTILFVPGLNSANPLTTPATPHGTGLSPGLFIYGNYFLDSGKVVASPYLDRGNQPEDRTTSLRLGERDGATLTAEIRTLRGHPENSRLLFTLLTKPESSTVSIGYALTDGNGGSREPESKEISRMVRPLKCKLHQPRSGPHDLLLLPTPLDWQKGGDSPHEDWALDEWFGEQEHGCWVLREAEDSLPLQESFLLMPGLEESTRPPYLICVFAETPPEQLVRELATVYRVKGGVPKLSPDAMTELEGLYKQVLAASQLPE